MGVSESKGVSCMNGVKTEKEDASSYWSIVRRGYEELVQAIIRPPRAEYELDRLGPTHFTFCGKRYRRTDLELVNQRGLILQCSWWEPVERPSETLPCVVFLHGNSSARLEGLNQLSVCLGYGMTLFAFDCAGSGHSEGEYVSLGYFEKDDLRVVVDHLRGSCSVSKIGVWGRSMGAVTALLYQAQDIQLLGPEKISVNAMVLDSPFADFCQLAEELVAKGRDRGVTVPKMVTRMALSMLANSVKSEAGFDISCLNPIGQVHKCTLPALFVCAQRDDFIGMHHTQSLHDAYLGPKFIIIAQGDHNTLRSSQSMLAIGAFLQKELHISQQWMLPDSISHFTSIPWQRPQTIHSGPRQEQDIGFGRDKVAAVQAKIGAAMSQVGLPETSSEETTHHTKDTIHDTPTVEEERWFLDQAHYYCNRGNALEESGKMDAAIRAYRAAITYHSAYPDAHYNLGIALKNRGHLEEAIIEYRRTVELKPDHADALNNLGVALEESGNVDEAVSAYREAISHNPEHSEAHCNLADALQSLGKIDEAISEYERAIARNPSDSDTINNLGVALEAVGRVDEAISAYSTAVAKKPDHWDAQANLGDALQLHGDLDRAAEVYAYIIKYNPTNAQIASSLGNVLHARDRHEEALEAYEIAVDHNPSDTVTHNNMGIVLQSIGEIDRAILSYTTALKHDPSYAIAHYNLGVALQSISKLDQAILAYKTAVLHRPGYADAYNNMGYALQQQGNLSEAIEAYKRAVKLRPDFASANANLKHALLEIDQEKASEPTPKQPPKRKSPVRTTVSREIDFVVSDSSRVPALIEESANISPRQRGQATQKSKSRHRTASQSHDSVYGYINAGWTFILGSSSN